MYQRLDQRSTGSHIWDLKCLVAAQVGSQDLQFLTRRKMASPTSSTSCHSHPRFLTHKIIILLLLVPIYSYLPPSLFYHVSESSSSSSSLFTTHCPTFWPAPPQMGEMRIQIYTSDHPTTSVTIHPTQCVLQYLQPSTRWCNFLTIHKECNIIPYIGWNISRLSRTVFQPC